MPGVAAASPRRSRLSCMWDLGMVSGVSEAEHRSCYLLDIGAAPTSELSLPPGISAARAS